MLWNDETDRLLVSLWDEGNSLAFVADKMREAGYVVSRNAIAGRKHRLAEKLSPFKRAPNTQSRVTRPMPSRLRRPSRGRAGTVKKTMDQLRDEMMQNEGVEYMLNDHGCKAILDKPRRGAWLLQVCCGKPRTAFGGSMSPYCAYHLRIYTNPPPQQRRANG
jgi:hypothetical protein